MTLPDWPAKAGSLLLLLLLPLPPSAIAGAASGPNAVFKAPTNLGADGALAAARKQPLVILFSLPNCAFCDVVRQNYLAPLARDGAPRSRLIVREVKITDNAELIGFQRKHISHRALAKNYGISFAPTVLLLDRDGKLLAPPIIGGDVSGMYGAVLDQALDAAKSKLARPVAPPSKDHQ